MTGEAFENVSPGIPRQVEMCLQYGCRMHDHRPHKVRVSRPRTHQQFKQLRVEALEYDGHHLVLAFHTQTPVPPEKILGLLQEDPERFSFSPDYRLTVKVGRLESAELLALAKKALQGFL